MIAKTVKLFLFLIIFPTIAFSARISGGGGSAVGSSGASSLGVAEEGTVVSSPTAQVNFVGAGVTVTNTGSTATVTIPGGSGGADNFGSHIATQPITAGFGISATTGNFSGGILTSTITAANWEQGGSVLFTTLGSSQAKTDNTYFIYDDSNKILTVGTGLGLGSLLSGVDVFGDYLGTGVLSLQAYGNTNNEGVYLDLESKADQAQWFTNSGVSTMSFSMKLDAQGGLNVVSTQTIVAPDSISILRLGVTDLPVGGIGAQVASPYILGRVNIDGSDSGTFRLIASTANNVSPTTNFSGAPEIIMTPGNIPQILFYIPPTGTLGAQSVSLTESTFTINVGAIDSSLDCSPNANGGALTAGANGIITCSDDDSGGGSGGGYEMEPATVTIQANRGFISRATSTFTTALDMSSATFMDSRLNVYTSSGIPMPKWTLADLNSPTVAPQIFGRLSEFTATESNNAITGGVGVSGVTGVPRLGRIYMADNNALGIHVMKMGDLSVRIASITLSGFNDPEAAEFMEYRYNDAGELVGLLFAVAEEQLNQIVIFEVSPSTQPQVITKANSLTLSPSGTWTLDATEGMESIAWNPHKRVFYIAKQNTNFEFRVVPYDGTFSPVATEPFDAEAKWGATMPAINDMSYDVGTRTCYAIGDLISSSTNDQDILHFDCETGDIIEHWDNYIDDAGLTTAAGWVQSEGIAVYHGVIWVSSEGNEVARLELGGSGSGAFTSSGGEATQSTADDILALRDSTDGTNVSLKLIQDLGAADINGDEVNCLQFERYDNNELEATQATPHKGRWCSETPVGTTGVQQESGAQLAVHTTLGSGTHGLNYNVTNMRLFNTGHVTVSSVNADLGGRFQVVGSSDEVQSQVRANTTQTLPIATWQTSGGRDVVTVSSEGFISTQIGTTTVRGRVPSVIDIKLNTTSSLAATETELFSSTFTAGTFFKSGDCISFITSGSFGSGVSVDKRIRAYFGSATIYDTGDLNVASQDWRLIGEVCRTGTSSQKSDAIIFTNSFGGVPDFTSPSQSMSANVLFRVTGSGTNAGDSVGEKIQIKYEPAPGQ